MADALRHFRMERDSRGVVVVLIDAQDRPVNVFDEEVVRELYSVVERLEQDPAAKLVVFRSAKPSGFIAGADIHRIQQIDSVADAQTIVGLGQQLFDRIERLPMPTIAVIHGPCLGGGLEFALACRHRVARDDAETRLGLPEVQLGLIPAWGGTQRLPRRAGLTTALRIILEGSKLSASKAFKVGLVDLSAPPERFDTAVDRFIADRLAGTPLPAPRRGWKGHFLDRTWLGQLLVLRASRREIGKHAVHYPALPAALKAIETGLRGSHVAGLTVEREEFSRLLFSDTSRNLIEIFFQRERARKASTWVPEGRETRPVNSNTVQRVAVLGAGTMGAGIAQLAASSGFSVVLKDVTDELVAAGMQKIVSLMDDAVRKGALRRDEADACLNAITATSQWAPLGAVDLAIEAVVEREEIKRDVFRQLSQRLGSNAVLASNTSSLPIGRIAEAATHRERVAGLHFFNPVHKMQLVEIVHAADTGDDTIATLVEFVRRTGKVPMVVADSPGFLVNRILSPYLDEAVRMVCEGVPPDEIDRQAVRFGMPMGPLELLDQVGLDVAVEVAGSLMGREASPTPVRLRAMVERGWRGKKSGCGFYTYQQGRRGQPSQWEEASSTPGRPPRSSGKAGHSSSGEMNPAQQRLVYPMLNEAARCLAEGIVPAAWMIDLGTVFGIGFAPFLGGPLRMADALGIRRVVHDLESLSKDLGQRFEPCELLRQMAEQGNGFYATSEHRPGPMAAAGELLKPGH